MLRGSLRFKLTLLVNLVILVPMVLYLLWDIHLERTSILESRIEVLQSMGHLVVEAVAMDATGDEGRFQELLTRFGEHHPHLEIYLLDEQRQVLASSVPRRLGTGMEEEEMLDVLAGRMDMAWDLDSHEGMPVLEITLPAGPVGIVHIAEPQSALEREINQARIRSVAFVVLLMALMASAVTLITNRMVIRRLRGLTRVLERTEWLKPGGAPKRDEDELAVLAGALVVMIAEIDRATAELRKTLDEKQDLLERVEGFNEELAAEVEATRRELEVAQEELLRKERLSALGELSAGLAHEIRNPLQIIQGTAEMVQRKYPDADLSDVVEEVRRMNQLVRDLLDYARPQAMDRSVIDPHALMERAILEAGLPREGIELGMELESECRYLGDEALLERVLVNLLRNAVEALEPGGGMIQVRTACWDDDGLSIEVEDDGAGIHEEDLGRVFTPFFSRKEAGVGMGLCLSRRVVEQHGGTLELRSKPGLGTTARVELSGGEESP